MTRARLLEAQADAAFETGHDSSRTSDLFTQGAVILATAMFFGGIGQVFRVRKVRLVLVAIATLSCVVGLARIFTLPMLRPS